jgi:hypothetical protein
MSRQLMLMFMRNAVGIGILSVLLVRGGPIYAQTALKPLLSLQDADLRGSMRAFDISPDGKTLVVEYATGEGQSPQGGRIGAIRVSTWDIGSSRIVRQQLIEGPIPAPQLAPNPQHVPNIRFTPDGKKLIAVTGPQIRVLDATDLSILYSILSLDSDPDLEGVAIRAFAVSRDSKWLAVLSSRHVSPCEPTDVHLFQLETGKPAARWSLGETCPRSIALSADGSQMLLSSLLSRAPYDGNPNLLLLDSHTGQALRYFDISAGVSGSSDVRAVDAQFMESNKFIVLVDVPMYTPANVPQSKLKIFDLGTGRLLHELSYPTYGVRGPWEVAAQASVAAVLGWGPKNPNEVMRDGWQGFERLLLFRLTDKEPFYVSPDDEQTSSAGNNVSPAEFLHLSSDGKVLAVFKARKLTLYEIADVR